jgi:hypothetical protein
VSGAVVGGEREIAWREVEREGGDRSSADFQEPRMTAGPSTSEKSDSGRS